MTRRERILEEMVGKGVQRVRSVQITIGRSLKRQGMPSIVRRACVGAEVIPVDARQPQIAREPRWAGLREPPQLHANVRELVVRDRRVFVTVQRIVDGVDLGL